MSDVDDFLLISLKIEGSYELFFSDFRLGIGLWLPGILDAFQSYLHIQKLKAAT